MGDNIPRRNTRQRQIILEELRRLHSHPTASQLYERTRRRLPKISLGTIYRNLDLLVRAGLVQKLETAGGEARFECCAPAHHHIRCVQCGRVADARGLTEDPVKVNVTEFAGYEITGCRLEFEGICPACRAANARSSEGPATDNRPQPRT